MTPGDAAVLCDKAGSNKVGSYVQCEIVSGSFPTSSVEGFSNLFSIIIILYKFNFMYIYIELRK